MENLKQLPLDGLHRELGGKMVPFAGYEMPVQYPLGVKGEHLHCRAKAGLFDVSHMGQAWLTCAHGVGPDAHRAVAAAIETLVPGEITKLGKGRIRYTVLLAEDGGILDDLMISRPSGDDEQGELFLVVNAAVKDADFALMQEKLEAAGLADLTVVDDRCLLALQGPAAVDVMAGYDPDAATMPFMSMRRVEIEGAEIILSRCGYTGEDGFELSVQNGDAERIARLLLAHDDVEPIGLGARDSLRLEAGLCLYGHDMTPAEDPVEASLTFAIGKRRRTEGGFPGFDRISKHLRDGTARVRVGLRPDGRAPAREGVAVQSTDGEDIGVVTSGGFGPTFNGPVAMGYVQQAHAAPGTSVNLLVRGKSMPATVVDLPFVPQRYYRAPK